MPRRLQGSAPPLDNDDILEVVLLRLPPWPSSLPRASLVSRRWRRLVSDARFLRRFRAHHGTPPLLGFYADATFVPTIDPPGRVPVARFSLDPQGDEEAAARKKLACCHGLVLAFEDGDVCEFHVFDPMSGHRSLVPFPAFYYSHPDMKCIMAAAVPDSSSDDRRLFRIVTIFSDACRGGFASVYSSESGAWEHRVAVIPRYSESSPAMIILRPGNIVGNAIYWTLVWKQGILEFDIDRQSLTVINLPPDVDICDCFSCQIMPGKCGKLALAVLAESSIRFWEMRETDRGSSPAKWLLHKTIQLGSFLPLGVLPLSIAGFAEESEVIFLRTDGGVFMIHLDTMKARKVLEGSNEYYVYPYSSF